MADDLATGAAAEVLGVHPDTLIRWTNEGRVRHWRTPKGQRRYRRADIEELRSTLPVETEAS